MNDNSSPFPLDGEAGVRHDSQGGRSGETRRRFVLRSGAAAAAGLAGSAAFSAQTRTDSEPRTLNGQMVPEPPDERSSGPVRPGRGSVLTDKVAVVTGAARGIGRAIAVEFAANGVDVIAIDIARPVSVASDAKPATEADLAESVRHVIDNNLNGTANTIRAFAPKLVARRRGRIIVLSSMQGKHGTKDASSYSASKWGIIGRMKSEIGGAGVGSVQHHGERVDTFTCGRVLGI
jgi:hypothetical protein